MDYQGDSPFFLSYQEGDPVPKTRFPSLNMRNPMEDVHRLIQDNTPGMDISARDYIWRVLEQQGVMEKAGLPGFEEAALSIIQNMSRKIEMAKQAHYTQKRAYEKEYP